MRRQVIPDMERGRLSIEANEWRSRMWNIWTSFYPWDIFNFNEVAFLAPSIQTMHGTYSVVTDSGQCPVKSFFFHISLHAYIYKADTHSVAILNQQMCESQDLEDQWLCPHSINLKFMPSNKHKMLIFLVECQHQTLTLCQVADTEIPCLPEILKLTRANLPCSPFTRLSSAGST